MKLSVISGSHRPKSQSVKVGRFAAQRAQELGAFESAEVLELAEVKLPFWDEEKSKCTGHWALWQSISKDLKDSDAFVVVSPEWSGMVPAALKNLFLLCDQGELAHKPALIISVSAGMGGTYPIAELRSSSYKNTRICYIPEHLIVRKVEDVFNQPGDGVNDSDKYLKGRLDFALKMLASYSKALGQVRAEGVCDSKDYLNGM